MNRFVRFLCLIFGISVDGGAAQREQWAERRRKLGIEPDEQDRGPDGDVATHERQSAPAAGAERR